MKIPNGIEHREQLSRQLTSRQVGMIAIGGAIGTGLFLGSSLAVRTAGPGVILSYAMGAAIALLLMGALSEMAVAHPTAGSFGVYAEIYLNPWAGFTVRYTYWAAQCIAIGGEATAIAIYCQWWFPQTPKWLWILAFACALVYINARSVGSFGSFEYWFAAIKAAAIVLFIVFGASLLAGFGPRPAIGFSNLTAHGGFLPTGWRGVWMAMVFVIFSYLGTEIVAVTAGEAKQPETELPRAMRTVVARLIVFYLRVHIRFNVYRSLESDSARHERCGQSFCLRVPMGRRSGCGPYCQFRGDYRRRIGHELQFLSGQPHDVFAGARRIRPGGLRGRFRARNARAGAAGFHGRAGIGHHSCAGQSRGRFCLSVRSLAFRRPLYLARDLCHASVLPLKVGSRRPAALARAHDRLPVHFRTGSGRHDCYHGDHVVGGGYAGDVDRGTAVARPAHSRILPEERQVVAPIRIVVLVGLPGSGKSTYLERLGITGLSSDAMRRLLADDETDQTINDRVFQTLRYLLWQRLSLARPVTYIDATNLTRDDRRAYIVIGKFFGCEIEALFFDVPLDICLARNAQRRRVVPESAMLNLAGKLQGPSYDEGFARIGIIR